MLIQTCLHTTGVNAKMVRTIGAMDEKTTVGQYGHTLISNKNTGKFIVPKY